MRVVPQLHARRRQAELMDQPELDPAAHRCALMALRRINGLSAAAHVIWRTIRDFCVETQQQGEQRPVRVLDVATGGGDLPIRLWKRARSEGIALEVAGCDCSAEAIRFATEHAKQTHADVAFFERDALLEPLPRGYDVLTSSLFLHHLDEPQAVRLMQAMGEAGELTLIDDLRRSALGWVLAYAGVRFLSRSRVAHIDGPRSVEGAFTCKEAQDLARDAQWKNIKLKQHWPCRFLLIGRTT